MPRTSLPITYRSIKSQSYARNEYVRFHKAAQDKKKVRGKLPKGEGVEFHSIRMLEKGHKSSESLRTLLVSLKRYLDESYKEVQYRLEVLLGAHEIQRRKKAPKGAGADRISSGMSRAFGKAFRKAIRVRRTPPQTAFTMAFSKRPSKIDLKEISSRARNLLSGKLQIIKA